MKNKYLRPELRTILDVKGQIICVSDGSLDKDRDTGSHGIIPADSKYSFNN